MLRLIVAALLLVVVGKGSGAQGDAPVKKLFEISISDNYESIGNVKWSPDGRYIAAQLEGPMQADGTTFSMWFVYDAVSGERISNGSTFFFWYANGQRALVSNDASTLTSWDVEAGELFSLPHSPESTQHYRLDELIYGDIALLQSGTLTVYAADDGTLKFTRTDVNTLPMYSPDQTHAAIETSEGIELYETATWTLLDSLPEYTLHMPWLEPSGWSGDNRHLIVYKGEHRRAFQPSYIWTMGEGLSAPIFNIDSMVWWSPDGTQMAEANDAEIRFFDSTTGERLSNIRGLPVGRGLRGLPWDDDSIISVDGRYMVTMHGTYAGSAPQYAAVTNLETGEVVFTERVGVGGLYISDDTLIWHEIGAFVWIVDLTGNAETIIHPLPYIHSHLNSDMTWMLAFDALFADVVDVVLYRLDPFTEYEVVAIPSFGATLNSRWSPDGRRFVVYGGEANTISVWEITDE